MTFKPIAGSNWVKFELARKKREQRQAAFAPLDIRPPSRTSLDDVLPWEGLGFVMRPPPVPVNIDAMPPLSKDEFLRIMRRLVYDPSNKNSVNGLRLVPIATLAHAFGYQRGTLRGAVKAGNPSKLMIKKMSPLLRKIEAGKIKAVWTGQWGKPRVELVNVVDAPVSG